MGLHQKMEISIFHWFLVFRINLLGEKKLP